LKSHGRTKRRFKLPAPSTQHPWKQLHTRTCWGVLKIDSVISDNGGRRSRRWRSGVWTRGKRQCIMHILWILIIIVILLFNTINSLYNHRRKPSYRMITEAETPDDAPKKALIYICGGKYQNVFYSVCFDNNSHDIILLFLYQQP